MKKSSCFIFFLVVLGFASYAQNIGIGTQTPDSSALLELSSNSKGFLPPRMTTTERNAISNPAVGLMIYNTTTDCVEVFSKGRWQQMFCGTVDSSLLVDTTIVTDIDGHTYPTVKICNQTWMAKNLDVARYRNGDIIPQVTDPTQWSNLTTGAWCWYNNDSATYGSVYGRLYNWYAVNDPRGLAPEGWHVASDGEWNKMTKCLDESVDTTCGCWSGSNIGIQLKNTSGWSSGGNGNNISGFRGTPGGCRYKNGNFYFIEIYGVWWSSSNYGIDYAWYRDLNYNYLNVERNPYEIAAGFSVRCVKDTPITTLNNGLVAYYPFNGNANDESGNWNNGTVNGATLTTDRFGNENSSYFFNGTNNYITTNTSFFTASNPHSISIWWYTTDSTKTNQTLFNTGPHTLENCAFHYSTTSIQPPNSISFGIGNGGGNWSVAHNDTSQISNTPPTNNQWHNLCWVKESTNTWKFYFDGILQYSFSSNTNTGSMNANLRFGAENAGYPGGGANFYGSLDDIRIYNRALTQEEISYLAGH